MKTFFLFLNGIVLSVHSFGQRIPSGWKQDAAFEARTPVVAQMRSVVELPTAFSRKADCPLVMNQQNTNTCVGYSLSAARTLLEVTRTGRKIPFSPIFIYKMSGEDYSGDCQSSITFNVLSAMQEKGAIPLERLRQWCVPSLPHSLDAFAKDYKILSYQALSDTLMPIGESEKWLQNIKNALIAGSGVVTGMSLDTHFAHTTHVWKVPPQFDKLNKKHLRHAMCIVGYNDQKFSNDGGFEILNSYGTHWGNHGFFWVSYRDFMRSALAAYELLPDKIANPPLKTRLSGKIQLKRVEKGPKSVLKIIPPEKVRGLFPVELKKSCFELAEPLHTNDVFQIFVQNNQAAFIYILSSDNTQKVETLFPHRASVSAFIGANQEITLPDAYTGIELDSIIGEESILILYSKTALDPSELKNALENASGDFPKRVATVLGHQLATPKVIQDDLGAISVEEVHITTTDPNHPILAMLLNFKHL